MSTAELVDRYLWREITLGDLFGKIMTANWEVRDIDPLTAKVMLTLAEATTIGWVEDEIRAELELYGLSGHEQL